MPTYKVIDYFGIWYYLAHILSPGASVLEINTFLKELQEFCSKMPKL